MTPEEGLRGLHELFGGTNDVARKRACRRYILDWQDGRLGFCFERSPPVDRDESTLMVDQIIDEELDDDIVPRKLVYLFPNSRFESWHDYPPHMTRLVLCRFDTTS